jgi:hypothetical protein
VLYHCHSFTLLAIGLIPIVCCVWLWSNYVSQAVSWWPELFWLSVDI